MLEGVVTGSLTVGVTGARGVVTLLGSAGCLGCDFGGGGATGSRPADGADELVLAADTRGTAPEVIAQPPTTADAAIASTRRTIERPRPTSVLNGPSSLVCIEPPQVHRNPFHERRGRARQARPLSGGIPARRRSR